MTDTKTRIGLRPSALETLRIKLNSLETRDLRYLLVELAGAGRLALGVPTPDGTAIFTGANISGSDHGDVAHLEIFPFEVICGEETWEEALARRIKTGKCFSISD